MVRLERLAVRGPRDQRVVVLERLERHVGRVALLGVRDARSCAVGFGRDELCELAPVRRPRKLVSKRLQRVTQWMSVVISVCGSA